MYKASKEVDASTFNRTEHIPEKSEQSVDEEGPPDDDGPVRVRHDDRQGDQQLDAQEVVAPRL